MSDHPAHKPLDYSHIVDGIYVGSNYCCLAHTSPLVAEGIRADISLESDRVDTPFGVECYVWLPVPDHAAPSLDQLEVGVTALQNLVRLGKKVYVHCKNGHGRAPTLVAAYLVRQGYSPSEAVKTVQEYRQAVHLQDEQFQILDRFSHTT